MSDRFTVISMGRMGYLIDDKLTKKTYDNVPDICKAMNDIWEQTLRFENHNQELVQRSIKYEDQIDELKIENNLLKYGDDLTDCECEVARLLKKLDNLYQYYCRWFEEERGTYPGDFARSWQAIANGDIDEDYGDIDDE